MDVIYPNIQGTDLMKGHSNFTNLEKKSVIDIIFGDIIGSVLNDPEVTEEIGELENQNCQLLDLLDENKPVSIG